MKKIVFTLLCMIAVIGLLSSCSLFGGSSETGNTKNREKLKYTENDFDDPAYDNEQDGAEIITVGHPEEDFIGKWAAGSDYSEYLYGKVKITIYDNHTWTGSITDEAFLGVWEKGENKITIKDAEGIIIWDLFFVEDGNLMFRNTKNPDVAIVLKSID